MDPRSDCFCIYTVCQGGFKNISEDEESRRLVVTGALRVYIAIFIKYARKLINYFQNDK